MNILMFGWEFPPHITGGLGTASYGLTRGLVKLGNKVLFVVPKAYGDEKNKYVKILNASDVEVDRSQRFEQDLWKRMEYIQIDSSLIPYSSPEEYEQRREEFLRTGKIEWGDSWSSRYNFSGSYGANLMEEVARYAEVAAQIAREHAGEFDVIHAHDWLTYYAGMAAKEVSGKPLVVHVHATEFDRGTGSTESAVYRIEKAGMEAADMVITVSDLTKHTVVTKYGIPESKIHTLYNAVTFKERSQEDVHRGVDDKIVTFLGRVTYQKGPEYFVEVARKVLSRMPNVRFVMAGSGDMLHPIIEQVARLGISDRFHFTGFLKGDEVARMFSISDIYVMPSVSEPFGISPLEAMRANVPVIISKQSGVAEILENAIKVDYWDIDAMADAIYGILSYPSLKNTLLEKGQEEVMSLKWNKVAEKLSDLYKTIVH